MKSQRGWYSFHDFKEPRPELIGIEEPKLHGIHLHIPEPQGENRDLIYRPVTILDRIRDRLPYSEWRETKDDYILKFQYGKFRDLTFTISKGKKTINIWNGCTRNPLTYNEFNSYLIFLQVVLGDIYEYSDIRCVQLGNNEDNKIFKLLDFKTCKLQHLKERFTQLYQSYEKGLRKEVHIYENLDAKALGNALLEMDEKGYLIANSTINRELTWKVEKLTNFVEQMNNQNRELKSTVDNIKTENEELKTTIGNLVDVLIKKFSPDNENQGGYTPPPEDPQSDFTGYG